MKNTPVNATTVYTPYVVINEPKVFRQVDWSTGMCDIFDDCSDCCCAFFCTSCFLYKLYSRAGEGFCSCLFVSLSQLRTKVRIERGIHGSLFKDMCVGTCFPFCAMLQINSEMKRTPPTI